MAIPPRPNSTTRRSTVGAALGRWPRRVTCTLLRCCRTERFWSRGGTNTKFLSAFLIGCISAFFVALGGCSTPPPTAKKHIFWPLPPQKPQLEFIGIFRTEKDFLTTAEKNSFFEKIDEDNFRYVFKSPFGIAADGKGKTFISDLLQKNIRVFDFNKKKVEYFGEAHLKRPMGLAIDGDGRLYVADGEAKRVVVFSPEGKLLFLIGNSENLKNPSCLAIDRQLKRIYVSDGTMHKIVAFDLFGQLLFSFGHPGKENGAFGVPQGIIVAPDGRIFVADMLNARIQVFDQQGNFLYTFGEQGLEYYFFENPKALAFSSDGILYILDHRKALLLAYTPEGEFLFATGSKNRTNYPLGFSTPTSIAIDENDVIYIADLINKRFSVWQHLSHNYLRKNPQKIKELAEFTNSKKNYLLEHMNQEGK